MIEVKDGAPVLPRDVIMNLLIVPPVELFKAAVLLGRALEANRICGVQQDDEKVLALFVNAVRHSAGDPGWTAFAFSPGGDEVKNINDYNKVD